MSTPSEVAMDLLTARRRTAERSDLCGPEGRAELTRATDVWLRQMFDVALAESGVPADDVCLAATGSYGREELSPRSDLDLILIHTSAAQVEALAESLWYPIWDAGIRMDHSVRSPDEARRVARSDIRATLGLMDLRPIAGNEALSSDVRSTVLADWRAHALSRASDLRELVDSRRERSGDLAQRIEPDVKDAYGGIREATVIRALAASWLVDVPHRPWGECLSRVLDIRDALHRQGLGNHLVLESQADVAAALGYAGPDDLLRSLYLAARTIAHVSDQSWSRWERVRRRPRTRRGLRRGSDRTPIANGLVVHDGEIHLARDVDVRDDPGLLLRAAACAAQQRRPLADATVALFTREALIPNPWTDEMRESFVSLLGAGAGLPEVFEVLDQAGLVEHLIPEWSPVRSAPQRDPVHTYTVDRHLVMTAAYASQYTREVDRPDLLLVGALLHDIGKARGGDHCIVGAALVRPICTRMGFAPADVETIALLVRWHLLLPETATRRDIADPATRLEVLDKVADPRSLRLLLFLALADQQATGPTLDTPWRERLLRHLVENVVDGSPGDPGDEVLAPSPEQLEVIGRGGVQVTSRPEADGLLITVGAPDRIGLLSIVAGVLAAHRLEVRSARVVTVGEHAAQDWHVRPFFGDAPDPMVIAEDIRRVLDGSTHIDEWLARREVPERNPDLPSARVLVSHDPVTHTRLEVRAHDEPGLLHRVAAIIAHHGAVIRGAVVATTGSEAIDSFFVVDASGEPLAGAQADLISDGIRAQLAGPRTPPKDDDSLR